MAEVAFLMLTLDRYELTKSVYEQNLFNAQKNLPPSVKIHTFIADNGSKDRRIVEYFKHRPEVSYHRINSKNEGVGRAFNQLYLRCLGDFVVFLGNDILMPEGWLHEGLSYAVKVPNSGIIGWDWGHGGVPAIEKKYGFYAHWLTPTLDKVFGTWLMRSDVIETLGLFHERFYPYGLEDSDFNNRVNLAGFKSLYIPNMKSQHLGADVGDASEYRAMKDESLAKNLPILSDQVSKYHEKGIVEPFPNMMEPI